MTADTAAAVASAAPATSSASSRSPRRTVDGLLVAAVLAGAAVRFWRLGAQSLWYDEWSTSEATSGGLSDVIHYAATREGIPPPFFLVMWAWVRLFGDGEAALRALPALAGVATIPVAYAIVRELGQPRRAARVAALLVAVNPELVWYSQEARPYTLLALFGALTLLAFVRVWRRGRERDLLLWGLAGAAALAVHYLAVFLVAAELGTLLMARRCPWRQVALACVPGGIMLTLLAPVAIEQHSRALARWISDWPIAERLREAGRSALVGPSPPNGRLWIVVAGIALAAVLLAVGGESQQRRAAGLIAGVGVGAVALALGATLLGVDVFLSRYVIASLVPLIVAVAIGLAGSRAGWVGAAAVVALGAVSLWAVVAVARDPDLQRADWAGVADAFAEGGEDRVLVVDLYGTLASPLLHYLDDEAEPLAAGENVRIERIDLVTAEPVSAPCNWFVGRACALVFLGAPPPEPLASEFRLVERVEVGPLAVVRYRASRPVTVTPEALVGRDRVAGALVLAAD